MGYRPDNTAPANTNNDRWAARAWINLYVNKKNADGTTRKMKIGAVALKDSKNDRALIARMKQEGACEALKAALIVEFNEVTDSEVPVDSLGF